MTRFRPCIDLHDGQVKQIVGGTLRHDGHGLRENFVSSESPAAFAARYRAAAALVLFAVGEPALGFVWFAFGELLERALHFRAVDSPKMPGQPAALA